MDLGTILTGIFATVAAIAGGISALVYSTQGTLRKSNSDLRGRVKDLEDERAELRTEVAELSALYKTAREIATGEVHWQVMVDQMSALLEQVTALVAKITAHQQDAHEHWDQILELLAVLRDAREHWRQETDTLARLSAHMETLTRRGRDV